MNWLAATNRMYANRIDYFKNQKALKLSDRELIQKLADDYCAACDNGDEVGKDKYMAGLMLKFWKDIGKMQRKCIAVSHLDYSDFYAQLFYCINTAMEYRAWKNPDKHTNAQACINSAISSRGAAEIIYFSNRDKYKANYNAASLDTPINSDSDDKESVLGDTISSDRNETAYGYRATSVIQRYVNEDQIVRAIILDNIAFGDIIKYSTEKSELAASDGKIVKMAVGYRQFSARKLVQQLTSPDSNYTDYFSQKYHVQSPVVKLALENITNSNNQKIYRQIEGTLTDIRNHQAEVDSLSK